MLREWIAAALVLAAVPAAAWEFGVDLIDATLRFDLNHGGDATREWATFDRVWRSPGWAGSRTHLVDELGIGAYLVTMSDAESGRLLASCAYDSYFGEYRTTAAAAAGTARTYHESVLLPWPVRPVVLRLARRERDGTARELLTVQVDPGTATYAEEPPPGDVLVVDAHVTGPPSERLDLLFVGEGYTRQDEELFHADLARFAEVLLGFEPYAAHRRDINIRGVLRHSQDRGADAPSRGDWRRTAVGASFDSLGSERYLLTEDNRALREVASAAPYDALVIMVNHQRYGGGGIYGTYATFTSRNQWSSYVLLHELGHSLVGLADEYYTSSVAYNDFYPRGVEPVEPNITTLIDPHRLKWSDLATRGVELPTPWEKREYDALDLAYQAKRNELNERIASLARSGAPPAEVARLEEESERLSAGHALRIDAFLASSAAAGVVGAFEGAGYSSEGLFRPAVDCIMFTKGLKPFCPVCRQAVERAILRHAQEVPGGSDPASARSASEQEHRSDWGG